MTLLYHIHTPYQTMVFENGQLTNIKEDALKYMIKRL
jgi:hypothetical protein